jgi:hypothetical protein
MRQTFWENGWIRKNRTLGVFKGIVEKEKAKK